jgi:hypothetical protein
MGLTLREGSFGGGLRRASLLSKARRWMSRRGQTPGGVEPWWVKTSGGSPSGVGDVWSASHWPLGSLCSLGKDWGCLVFRGRLKDATARQKVLDRRRRCSSLTLECEAHLVLLSLTNVLICSDKVTLYFSLKHFDRKILLRDDDLHKVANAEIKSHLKSRNADDNFVGRTFKNMLSLLDRSGGSERLWWRA